MKDVTRLRVVGYFESYAVLSGEMGGINRPKVLDIGRPGGEPDEMLGCTDFHGERADGYVLSGDAAGVERGDEIRPQRVTPAEECVGVGGADLRYRLFQRRVIEFAPFVHGEAGSGGIGNDRRLGGFEVCV